MPTIGKYVVVEVNPDADPQQVAADVFVTSLPDSVVSTQPAVFDGWGRFVLVGEKVTG